LVEYASSTRSIYAQCIMSNYHKTFVPAVYGRVTVTIESTSVRHSFRTPYRTSEREPVASSMLTARLRDSYRLFNHHFLHLICGTGTRCMVRSPTLLLNPYLRQSKSFNTILYTDLSILVSKLFVHLSIDIILVLLSSHKKVCFGNLIHDVQCKT